MAGPPRVAVDHDVCVGFGQCVFLVPEVFRHNDARQSEVVDPAGAPLERILEAVRSCPTGAISVAEPS